MSTYYGSGAPPGNVQSRKLGFRLGGLGLTTQVVRSLERPLRSLEAVGVELQDSGVLRDCALHVFGRSFRYLGLNLHGHRELRAWEGGEVREDLISYLASVPPYAVRVFKGNDEKWLNPHLYDLINRIREARLKAGRQAAPDTIRVSS
jgi:hypothetical protein